jgi:hypothetical protein
MTLYNQAAFGAAHRRQVIELHALDMDDRTAVARKGAPQLVNLEYVQRIEPFAAGHAILYFAHGTQTCVVCFESYEEVAAQAGFRPPAGARPLCVRDELTELLDSIATQLFHLGASQRTSMLFESPEPGRAPLRWTYSALGSLGVINCLRGSGERDPQASPRFPRDPDFRIPEALAGLPALKRLVREEVVVAKRLDASAREHLVPLRELAAFLRNASARSAGDTTDTTEGDKS